MFGFMLAAALVPPPARDVRSHELLSSVILSGSCARSCRGDQRLLGTGEIVGRRNDGQLVVLTARHVVEDMLDPHVYVRNGVPEGTRATVAMHQKRGLPGRVIAESTDTDLALVVFRPGPSDSYAVATLAADAAVHRGDVVGGPNGALWTVSPYRAIPNDPEPGLVSCETYGPGDSGGGVFDARGALAGILISQQVLVKDNEPISLGTRSSRFKIVSLDDVRTFVASVPQQTTTAPAVVTSDPWSRFERPALAPPNAVPGTDARPPEAPANPWSRFEPDRAGASS